MTTPIKEEGTPWEIHDVVNLYWSKLASKVKSILTEEKRHSHQRTGLAKQPAVVFDRCLQKKKSRLTATMDENARYGLDRLQLFRD